MHELPNRPFATTECSYAHLILFSYYALFKFNIFVSEINQ